MVFGIKAYVISVESNACNPISTTFLPMKNGGIITLETDLFFSPLPHDIEFDVPTVSPVYHSSVLAILKIGFWFSSPSLVLFYQNNVKLFF